jgi:hypothetical protein
MLIGQEGENPEELEVEREENVLTEEEIEGVEEALLSIHATSGNPDLHMLRFKGKVGERPVYALLDSASSHSFLDPAILGEMFH